MSLTLKKTNEHRKIRREATFICCYTPTYVTICLYDLEGGTRSLSATNIIFEELSVINIGIIRFITPAEITAYGFRRKEF